MKAHWQLQLLMQTYMDNLGEHLLSHMPSHLQCDLQVLISEKRIAVRGTADSAYMI